MSKKRKRKSVPKDKKTGVPKKYLSGLKGSKRMTRARLIKQVASIYKSGGFIPRDLLKRRTRSYWHQNLEDLYQHQSRQL